MFKLKKLILVFLISVLCSGCGFHLRTEPHEILGYRIISSAHPYDPLVLKLRKNECSDDNAIEKTVVILSVDRNKKIGRVFFTTKEKIIEYQYDLSVQYQVMDQNNKILFTDTIKRSRTNRLWENHIITSNNADSELYSQMDYDVIEALYLRLRPRQLV